MLKKYAYDTGSIARQYIDEEEHDDNSKTMGTT
jgi:hypothetical protein